jgi:hypothetical protein
VAVDAAATAAAVVVGTKVNRGCRCPPFCGVAPCGIAAVQLGRRYHGIDTDATYRRIAERRIAAYGTLE